MTCPHGTGGSAQCRHEESVIAHLEVVQPLGIDSQYFIVLVKGKQVHITNALLFLLFHILGLWLDPCREAINLERAPLLNIMQIKLLAK